ncbi:MAG: transcriptional regulator, partial [Pedobacter sp.]
MELAAAKLKFIEAWGKLGSEWGINRTMAQVHALLLISPEALTTEEIMETLSISRGNANMTLRDL